jgi:molybdenum cofactor cytidylyltransferase
MKSVAALILAAGKSERMGSPKPLLRIHGRTFLEKIAEEAQSSQLHPIRTVLGHRSSEILEVLPQFQESAVINPKYELGQLSSLQCGLRSLAETSLDGVMVFLIDHPFVHRDLANQLLRAFSAKTAPVVVPSFQNRRGHPMIFASSVFEELLRAPLDQGAVAVVKRHHAQILHLEVNDPGVLIDIDTPEDYNEFVVKAGNQSSA